MVVCSLAFACGNSPQEAVSTENALSAGEVVNRVHRVRSQVGIGGGAGNLVDHGGRVTPAINFYVIYWGTGFVSTTPSLVNSFLGGLGSSGYWTIDSQYLRGAANSAAFQASWTDTSAAGSVVLDTDIQAEVSKAINGGHLPYDSKARSESSCVTGAVVGGASATLPYRRRARPNSNESKCVALPSRADL